MLTRILKEFRESEGNINLNELGWRLGIERSALDGMLATLVRQGKIKEVGNEKAACAGCAQNTTCPYAGGVSGKIFRLNE